MTFLESTSTQPIHSSQMDIPRASGQQFCVDDSITHTVAQLAISGDGGYLE